MTVDAIRQIKISGDTTGASKVGAVILAALDIDFDVFKSEMRRIGRPQKPFFIIMSKDDQALGISSFNAGDKARLGAESNVQELASMGAIVVDLTTLKGTDFLNHGKFAQLAGVAPRLRHVLQDGIAVDRDLKARGKAVVCRTQASFITLPIRIIDMPRRIIPGQ